MSVSIDQVNAELMADEILRLDKAQDRLLDRQAKWESIAARIVVAAKTHYVDDFWMEDLADECRELLGWVDE